MRITKFTLLLSIFLLGALKSSAQQASVPDVIDFRSQQNSGEIIQNGKIAGYYVFYLKEKLDKKNNAYEIELFDDNFNSTKTIEIVRSKYSTLLEMVYNGQAFMLHFYDPKIGYEFVTYQRSGEIGQSTIVNKKNISQWDLQRVQANLASNTENITIFPNGNEGFIRSTFLKNDKMGFEITAYDNNAQIVWQYGSDPKSEKIETIEIADVSTNVLSATISRRKNLFSRDIRMSCLLLNTKDGSLIKEFELGSEAKGPRSLLKSFVNEKNNSIILVGEYYKPDDDIVKNKSQGIYMQVLSLKGEVVSNKDYLWKGDIDKFKNQQDPEDAKNDRPFLVFFHNIFVAENGHIFMIGEQFIKQVSAGGVALKVLSAGSGGGSGASAFEIRVADMIVFEFDENKEMVAFNKVNKKKTSVLLGSGMGLVNTTTLGYYIKSKGGFDYVFTSKDRDKDHFEVIYIDADRKEDKKSSTKSDVMLGVIKIKNGGITLNRVPINSETKNFWIQQAKPGYISIAEYYRKEKRLDFRLEQLTY